MSNMEISVVAKRRQLDDPIPVRALIVARFLHLQQAIASQGESRTAIGAERGR